MRLFAFVFCLLAWSALASDSLPSVSLSHSGRYVAVQDADGSASVIDTSSDNRKLLGKGRESASFVWSYDDKTLLVIRDGKVFGCSIPAGHISKALAGNSPVSSVDISPDGRYVSFIKDYNLWVSSNEGKTLRQLTQNGNSNLLVGSPDIVYGHEFDVTKHYWWSPDSASIAVIETAFADNEHYVIPGGKLPVFRLKIIDLATGQSRQVAETDDQWAYLLRVVWNPDSKRVFFYRMNRLQNLADLCYFDNGEVKILLTEKDAYWLNAPETPVFVNASRQLVVSSERSGARHIYLYGMDGQLISDLTPPDTEVYRLHPETNGHQVFISSSSGSKQEQQLFRINLDGTPAQLMTTEVGWHETSLNAAGNIYIDRYSSACKPPALLWHGADAKVREILAAATAEKPVVNEFLPIKTHDNVQLPARLYKPDDFDPQKKYPVILYTFSGPHGRVVADQWGGWQMDWNRSMVRQGFLVLAVDVRGSSGYGHLFEEYIHYRFGAQETADLREVVSFLRRQSYVDATRLGIWGCDYGAHIVVHAMWQFPGGFRAGFADTPIADWTKYSAYFTERYLGLPAKRYNEYHDSAALDDARRMTGSLLVISRPDDPQILPVHVEALQKAVAGVKKNKEVIAAHFQVLPFPDEVAKLMAEMTKFFKQKL